MIQIALRMTFFIALLLLALSAETKELTLKSRLGDVRLEEQNQGFSIDLDFEINFWNPLEVALYAVATFDFIDSISEQITDHFEQANEDISSPLELENDFQSQVQSQFEEYVQNYVERNLRRIYGVFGWMLHTGVLCAFLFAYDRK